MSDAVSPLPAPDDRLAATVEETLRFRFRAFCTLIATMVVLTAVVLLAPGSGWAEWAGRLSTWIVGLGVPWMGWHLRIPFVGRPVALIVQIAGFSLNGSDPRGELWTLGILPLEYFLFGWLVDVFLRQDGPRKKWVGRVGFTLLWLFVLERIIGSDWANPKLWSNALAMLAGVAVVWRPRGYLLPMRLRSDESAEPAVREGLQSAGSWLASRAAIVMLLILPSLVFLDLLDLPPRLEEAAKTGADELPGAVKFFYWTRDARALTAEDFRAIEVYAAAPESTRAVVDAVNKVRRNPTDPAPREALAALGEKRVDGFGALLEGMKTAPVFYIDPIGSGDERVTAGLWTVPDSKRKGRAELRLLPMEQHQVTATEVARSTTVILAGGILILLLLGGPSGGSSAAWWLAIFLAGSHFGWVSGSLDLVVERVRFVIWRDHSLDPIGGTLFSLYALLISCMRLTEWLVVNLVAHAGLWVALCWPVRPGPLIRNWRDRMCLQAAKTLLVWVLVYLIRYALFFFGTVTDQTWPFYAWFFVMPALLVGSGYWWRSRIGEELKLPRVGALAVTAILLRLTVLFFNNISDTWGPNVAVGAAVVAAILLVVALERGSFLNPPHVEGQLWIIGVAAIPFIENVIGDPVSGFLETSDLFLGSTIGWIAFAASLWVIGPITDFVSDFLSRWRARGLDEIEEFSGKVIEASRDFRSPEIVAGLCVELFDGIGIEQGQLWRYRGEGIFYRVAPSADGVSYDLVSKSLADALAGASGSLRLEEMRLEWRWAAYHGELERWFREGGDLIIVPSAHEGHLLGVFACPDVDANRFLLRPAVGAALTSAMAAALLQLDPPTTSGETERT